MRLLSWSIPAFAHQDSRVTFKEWVLISPSWHPHRPTKPRKRSWAFWVVIPLFSQPPVGDGAGMNVSSSPTSPRPFSVRKRIHTSNHSRPCSARAGPAMGNFHPLILALRPILLWRSDASI
eukprot:932842-Amphidinium_carterae.1